MTAEVLVVVPVYGDIDSLLRCVDALRAHVDTRRHRVLFVNDSGPDADTIEQRLLERIADVPGFRYERNDHNLGFVGTCNRAVLELDEGADAVLLLNSDAVPTEGFLDAMAAVLFADDTTGVVTARSDNATIASIPYRRSDNSSPRTPARTSTVWSSVAPFLPPSQLVPVAMGFCFMVRRELITRYGLFDEAFAPGYGEENDFCLRIAADGWTSRIANRALVFHEGSKSFASDRRPLRVAHQRELERRYPFLPDAITAYLRLGVSAAERFADCLVPSGSPLRVAIDLRYAADPASILQATRTAFDDPRFQLEPILPEDGADVPNPEDLVTVTILLDPTVSEILDASRRALLIGVISEVRRDPHWSDRARRSGSDRIPTETYAVDCVEPDRIDALRLAVDTALAAPLAVRVKHVTERWKALELAELGSLRAGSEPSQKEIHRLRSQLTEIQRGRAYRLAHRLSALRRRLPGRPR